MSVIQPTLSSTSVLLDAKVEYRLISCNKYASDITINKTTVAAVRHIHAIKRKPSSGSRRWLERT